MAYAQIANIIPQFENYPNWWLKAYEQSTTTPLPMATDSSGATTAAKFEINSNGFPKTAGDALVIPYINAAYDLWLFPTEAEADANDTTNAIQLADNIDLVDNSEDIDFLQAGTGASIRTVRDKLRDSLSVLDFGASGDGIEVDTTILQAALTEGASSGKEVVFPKGYTFLTGSLTVTSNTRIRIEGTVRAVSSIGANSIFYGSTVSNVHFCGHGTVDGNFDKTSTALTTTECTGIRLDTATNCSFRDLTITNCYLYTLPGNYGAGLWVNGGSDCLAENITSNDHRGCGICFTSVDDGMTRNCVSNDLTFGSGIAHTQGNRAISAFDRSDNCAYSNITINCLDSIIIAPVATNSDYAGVNIGHDSIASDATGTKMIGGYTAGNAFAGVYTSGSENVIIQGVKAFNNGLNGGANDRYGIRATTNSKYVSIIGCEVTGTKNSGIQLEGLGYHSVIGCQVHDNDRVGISVSAPNCTIRDTSVFNNNQLGGTNRAGIQLTDGETQISGCYIYDDQTGAETQSYGIQATADNHIVSNVKFGTHAVSNTNLSGTGALSLLNVSSGTNTMTGTFTLTAGTSTVVANDNATSANRITIRPRSGTAASLNAYVTSVVSGTSFTVAHNTASGGESFSYTIES